MGRKFCNFAYCKLLENAIKIKLYREAPKQAHLKMKMFLGRGTLNPNNENYLVKTIGSKLQCVIHDSTTTAIANLIFLANIPTPDSLIQHLQWIVTSICLLCWYSGLTKGNFPRKCIESVEVYANKALKVKSAYHYTNRKIRNVKVLLLKQFL